MKFGASSALLLFFFMTGCAIPRVLVPSSNNGSITYDQGCAILQSEKKHLVVVRLFGSHFTDDDPPVLHVAVLNRGDQPFLFAPEYFRAFANEQPIAVLNYDRMRRRVQSRADLAALAVALNSTSRSIQAAQPAYGQSSGAFNVYGDGGTVRGNYSATGQYNNPAMTSLAQSAINAESTQAMGMIASGRNAQLAGLEGMLRLTTVVPGQIVGGIVMLDGLPLLADQRLTLTILAESEPHQFEFYVNSVQP